MATQETLAAYVDSVRHKFIDVDGVFGAQCWDQWSHYATNFLGVPSWPTYTNAGGTGPHSGYACNVWHNFEGSGLSEWFVKVGPGEQMRAGDVPIWEYGTVWYPWSHIATLLEVRSNGMLRCLTQNPGAAQVADLIPRGLLGALRPRKLTVGDLDTGKTPTLTSQQKWEAKLKPFDWKLNRKSKQTIPANKPTRAILNDNGDVSVRYSAGAVFSVHSTVRLKAKPGERVNVELVVENGNDKRIESLGAARAIFDEIGLATVNISGSCVLKDGQRIRTLIHTSAKAGRATVEDYVGNGFFGA